MTAVIIFDQVMQVFVSLKNFIAIIAARYSGEKYQVIPGQPPKLVRKTRIYVNVMNVKEILVKEWLLCVQNVKPGMLKSKEQ